MKSENPKAREEQLGAVSKRKENVPGLVELRMARGRARTEERYYDAMFARMLDDGECMKPSFFVRIQRDKFLVLTKKYSRAALYLRAIEHIKSFDNRVYRAGSRALQVLVNGGRYHEAKKILDNWQLEDDTEF